MSDEIKQSRCSIVVAFDVGTSHSGYAWALVMANHIFFFGSRGVFRSCRQVAG